MNWIPLLTLIGLAILGPALKKLNSPRFNHWQTRLYVVNAFAIGLIAVWISASWIRALYLVPQGHSWNVFDVVFAPAVFFPIEGWVLLAAIVVESFYLRGNYSISNEWKMTLFDGMKTAGLYVSISTILFFPIWWMIQPGKYGKFEPSVVQRMVTGRADQFFQSNPKTPVMSPEAMTLLHKSNAIPSAVVMAALLAGLTPLIRPTIRYFKTVMDDEYMHLPPKPKDGDKQPQRPLPVPRGGGPN